MIALEAASDVATSYLITGNNESLKLVRHLAGNDIADLLEHLRQTDSEDRPLFAPTTSDCATLVRPAVTVAAG